MGIVAEFSNSVNVTERTLREQAAADRRLFETMRQAEDEKFFSRPDWMPEDYGMQRRIDANEARIAENRRILDEERHEEFLDQEFIRRGGW